MTALSKNGRESSALVHHWQLNAWMTLTQDARLDYVAIPDAASDAAVFFGRDLWALRALDGVTPRVVHGFSIEIARCYMIHRVRTDLTLLEAVELNCPREESTPNEQFAWLHDHGLIVKSILDLRIFEWIPREIVCIENQAAFEAALAAYRSATQ